MIDPPSGPTWILMNWRAMASAERMPISEMSRMLIETRLVESEKLMSEDRREREAMTIVPGRNCGAAASR